ncbi:hypothetical protein FOA52_000483 [Chlamydomonas sp. UWO 241]|nr:hypothetical protein FOA52_000483 [Chlamydomonas sp. UWO 241]
MQRSFQAVTELVQAKAANAGAQAAPAASSQIQRPAAPTTSGSSGSSGPSGSSGSSGSSDSSGSSGPRLRTLNRAVEAGPSVVVDKIKILVRGLGQDKTVSCFERALAVQADEEEEARALLLALPPPEGGGLAGASGAGDDGGAAVSAAAGGAGGAGAARWPPAPLALAVAPAAATAMAGAQAEASTVEAGAQAVAKRRAQAARALTQAHAADAAAQAQAAAAGSRPPALAGFKRGLELGAQDGAATGAQAGRRAVKARPSVKLDDRINLFVRDEIGTKGPLVLDPESPEYAALNSDGKVDAFKTALAAHDAAAAKTAAMVERHVSAFFPLGASDFMTKERLAQFNGLQHRLTADQPNPMKPAVKNTNELLACWEHIFLSPKLPKTDTAESVRTTVRATTAEAGRGAEAALAARTQSPAALAAAADMCLRAQSRVAKAKPIVDVRISVRDRVIGDVEYTLAKTMAVHEIMAAWCTTNGISPDSVHFEHVGQRCMAHDTVGSLKMRKGGVLKAVRTMACAATTDAGGAGKAGGGRRPAAGAAPCEGGGLTGAGATGDADSTQLMTVGSDGAAGAGAAAGSAGAARREAIAVATAAAAAAVMAGVQTQAANANGAQAQAADAGAQAVPTSATTQAAATGSRPPTLAGSNRRLEPDLDAEGSAGAQAGGRAVKARPGVEVDKFDILVQCHNMHDSTFRVSPRVKVEKIMAIWCKKMEISPDSIYFRYDGRHCAACDTVGSLGMKDGDVLTARRAKVRTATSSAGGAGGEGGSARPAAGAAPREGGGLAGAAGYGNNGGMPLSTVGTAGAVAGGVGSGPPAPLAFEVAAAQAQAQATSARAQVAPAADAGAQVAPVANAGAPVHAAPVAAPPESIAAQANPAGSRPPTLAGSKRGLELGVGAEEGAATRAQAEERGVDKIKAATPTPPGMPENPLHSKVQLYRKPVDGQGGAGYRWLEGVVTEYLRFEGKTRVSTLNTKKVELIDYKQSNFLVIHPGERVADFSNYM